MKSSSIILWGSLLMIVGSVLPWAHWTGVFDLSHNFSGLAGDGKFSLAAGVLAGLAALFSSRLPGRSGGILCIILGLGAGFLAVRGLLDPDWARQLLPSVTMRTSIGAQMTVSDPNMGTVSAGYGIYLVIAAALMFIMGGVMNDSRSEA